MKPQSDDILAKIDGSTNLSLAEETKRLKIRFTKPEQFMFGVATRLCHNQKDAIKSVIVEIRKNAKNSKKEYHVIADILLPRPRKMEIPFTDERTAASALMDLEMSTANRAWEDPILSRTIIDGQQPSTMRAAIKRTSTVTKK